MPSVKKTKKGDYRVQVYVKGKRASKCFPTKAKARSWGFEKEEELRKLLGVKDDSFTFGDLLEKYSKQVTPAKRGAQWELVRLKKFGTYKIAKIKLSEIVREDFQEWVELRLSEVLASSVNRELNLISHCLTQARVWRLMAHNPLKDLQRPKNPPHRDRRISQAEIDELCLACNYMDGVAIKQKSQIVAVAFLFAIETAMRAGEICSLTLPRINFKTKVAFLAQTKNGLPREVPLSSRAVELLGKLPRQNDVNAPVFGLSSGSLSTLFRKYRNKTSVTDLTFHDSRHEAITRLAETFDVLDLARAVGHRDIKQLMTYYNKGAEDLAKLLD